ncbi:MAG: polyhydroxyalkanoate depolymerase [Neomegalonema sp.]|nr:polyhydroxyalkanoate depolymerase [Neomegalonema sp.]
MGQWRAMLYQTYEFQNGVIGPLRALADAGRIFNAHPAWQKAEPVSRWVDASLEMISRFTFTHARPNYSIESAGRTGEQRAVTEEVALSMPFGDLLKFAKEGDEAQPKVLVIAPLSGHFATLLRGTVKTLLQDHAVYITDWKNARDVPLADGDFDVDDYVAYIIRFLEEIGPGAHIVAVCQPCVQALVAAAVMAEDDHPAQPRSMTLMAGPIDVKESPTEVNDLATQKPISWFKSNLIAQVPSRYAGAGRKVYPGFVQLSSFMAMNMERHNEAHRKLYGHLAAGETEKADKIKRFYDEYFAVLDLTESFYLGTVERIFQQRQLAKGEFTYRGRLVNPNAIRKTALLTVEGGRDDICGMGQTSKAHELCGALRPHLKRHHLQANVGHYGVFNGKRWEHEIYPVVRNLILSVH